MPKITVETFQCPECTGSFHAIGWVGVNLVFRCQDCQRMKQVNAEVFCQYLTMKGVGSAKGN